MLLEFQGPLGDSYIHMQGMKSGALNQSKLCMCLPFYITCLEHGEQQREEAKPAPGVIPEVAYAAGELWGCTHPSLQLAEPGE